MCRFAENSYLEPLKIQESRNVPEGKRAGHRRGKKEVWNIPTSIGNFSETRILMRDIREMFNVVGASLRCMYNMYLLNAYILNSMLNRRQLF